MFNKLRQLLESQGRAQGGFTVIEVMIAIVLLTVGIMSTVTVANATFHASVGNEEKTVAANLAREGIELVRNARDSNWQAFSFSQQHDTQAGTTTARNPWDCVGLTPGHVTSQPITCDANLSTAQKTYAVYLGGADQPPYFKQFAGTGGITQPSDYAAHPEFMICPTSTSVIYTPSNSCTGRPYYRRIVVEPSGRSTDIAGSCSGGPAGNVAPNLKVSSYVTWQEPNGKFHSEVLMQEYLSNWRRCSDVLPTPVQAPSTPTPAPTPTPVTGSTSVGKDYTSCQAMENYGDGLDTCFITGTSVFAYRMVALTYFVSVPAGSSYKVSVTGRQHSSDPIPAGYAGFGLTVTLGTGTANIVLPATYSSQTVSVTVNSASVPTSLRLQWTNNLGSDPNMQIDSITVVPQ